MGRRGKNRIYEVWKAFPDRAVFDQFWATEKGEWTRRKAYEAKGLVQMTSELWDCRYCSTVNRAYDCPQKLKIEYSHTDGSVSLFQTADAEHNHQFLGRQGIADDDGLIKGGSLRKMKEKGFKKEQMSSQPTAPKLKKMMPLDGHHNFFPAGPTNGTTFTGDCSLMGQQNQVATAVVKQQPMDVGRDLTLSTNKYSTNGLSHSMNGSFYSSSREVDNSDEPTAPASAAAAYESPMETFAQNVNNIFRGLHDTGRHAQALALKKKVTRLADEYEEVLYGGGGEELFQEG